MSEPDSAAETHSPDTHSPDTHSPDTPLDVAPVDQLGVSARPPDPAAGEAPTLELTDPTALRRALEAVLFVVDAPVTIAALAAALQQPALAIEQAMAEFRDLLDARQAGIEVREAAGGFRLYTRPAWAGAVEAFVLEGQRNRLSQASLETLAVIAYRQPITRARISAIRGVTVDGVVRTLLARGLVVETGTDAETGAGLLASTELFLERMGLSSLAELPSLAPLLPDAASLDALEGLDVDEL